MSALDDALARLGAYNPNPYDATGNPFGFSGRGGVPANWVPALRDVASVHNAVAGYYNDINFVSARASMATLLQQGQDLVRQITVGSTSSLAFPAVDKLLLSATDVVDVFVYYTMLDDRLPDGTRWNEPGRCAGLSWYEEGPSATRGVKRDFPLVALIVARQTTLTIYDGLDIDPVTGGYRLWGVHQGFSESYPITSIEAANGRIFVTVGGAGAGLVIYEYLLDRVVDRITDYRLRASAVADARVSPGSLGTVIDASGGLISTVANAVSVRTIPGAPLDAAGLPIPTVAVATTGGVSVIHPWGQVASITGDGAHRVSLDADNLYFVAESNFGVVYSGPVPYVSATISAWRGALYSVGKNYGADLAILGAHSACSNRAITGADGITHLVEDHANPQNGMVAYTTNTYATGIQCGDIRGAWLCDATTGSITGSGELVTNGDFSVGSSGWETGSSWSVAGGKATNNGGSDVLSQTLVGVVTGRCYAVTFTVSGASAGSLSVSFGSTAMATGIGNGSYAVSAAAVASGALKFTPSGAFNGSVGGISCELAAADRSYKAKGLIVNGTLQRNPVASGADMVAWSGFSASNYLSSTSADICQHGTSDLSITFWYDFAGGNGTPVQVVNGSNSLIVSRSSGGRLIYINGIGFLSNSGDFPAGMMFGVLARRSGVWEWWENGTLIASQALAVTLDGTEFQAGKDGTAPSTARMSMLRVSGYAPTAAQIRRMYEDERKLFQVGAKCLLGGVSNNITDMDHDPLTGRLAVATDGGTSIFNGLQRVAFSPVTSATSTNHKAVSLRGRTLLVGTSAEAAARTEAIGGKEEILTPEYRKLSAPFMARGVTIDATPLDLAPRIHVGERELVEVEARILGRVYGATDGQRISYVRKATSYRDAGGNVTLQGSVQSVGTDTEVDPTADATLLTDTTAQTISARVTGVAGTRIAWTATFTVTRYSEETSYAA